MVYFYWPPGPNPVVTISTRVGPGSRLLGHRPINSRLLEKSPSTEGGWKRRSKKRPRTGILRGNARDAMCASKFAPSRHAFDLHTFCVWLGLFVDRWWLKEVWYAPGFSLNCSTCVPIAAPGITGSPSKRICRGTLSQKTPKLIHLAGCTWPVRGPACARLCSGKLACAFSLRTNASSSVPSLHLFS